MPTPKFTPGAALFPINLTAPAFNGLTLEASGNTLGPEWATELDNAVFDAAGRPSARKGWASETTTPGTDIHMRIFEYYKADGTSEIIFSSDSDIFKTVTNPASIDGSLTITEGNIKFVNFNDKCIAFGIGASGKPAVYTGTTFATITVNSGTAPTSGIGTAAFGRLWAVDTDGKTIRYSALLDETRWAVADGGGIIDFSNVWPAGQDSITAIEEFGGDLIVFGSFNTVIMTDGAGSALGVEPDDLYVSDTIPGLGALTQFGIARAIGDLWVLTREGVTSLGREIRQRSTEINNLSRQVQSQVLEWIGQESDINDITLEYNPEASFVILNFPGVNKQVIFDTRSPLQDGSYRLTTWTSDIQTIHHNRSLKKLQGSLTGTVGEIFNYSGAIDNATTYTFAYESGWLDLGTENNLYLKFVKRMTSFVLVESNVTILQTIQYDFGTSKFSFSKTATRANVIEWGQFEWGTNGLYDKDDASATAGVDIAEWGGGAVVRTLDVSPRSGGQYIKVGIKLNTNSGIFSLQQINLFAKIGRIAT